MLFGKLIVSEADKLCVVTIIAWSATKNLLLRGMELVVLFTNCADVEVVAGANVVVVLVSDATVVVLLVISVDVLVVGANVVVVLVSDATVVVVLVSDATVVVLLVILVDVLVVGTNEVVLFIAVLVMYLVVLVEVGTVDVSIWFRAIFFSNCDGNTVYAPFATTKFPVTVIVLPITAKVGSLELPFPTL